MTLKAAILSSLLLGGVASSPSPAHQPVRLSTRSALNSRLANIHVEIDGAALDGKPISVTYGSCDATGSDAQHVVAGSVSAASSSPSTVERRLVWRIPEELASGGCLSAWAASGDGEDLVGRSEPQRLDHQTMRKRSVLAKRSNTAPPTRRALDPVKMTNESGIDAHGPWFDGVALLEGKNVSVVDVEAAKAKQVAIVGAGMSGLMTYLLLSQAGFKNLSLIEGGNRLGGRVQTEYLSGGPFDYSYQEMGPMRFPHQITFGNETLNISDHAIVFQLAKELNALNKGDRNLSVDFIPWIQSSPNGLSYSNGFKLPSGLPPTLAQIAADPSLGAPAPVYDAETNAVTAALNAALPGLDFYKQIAQNSFKAHKAWLENRFSGLPGDHWSQYAYIKNYLGASLNTTDILAGALLNDASSSFFMTLYESVYFSASSWKTIDGGLNRLPLAFHPLVDGDTTLGRKVDRIGFSEETNKVTLQWKEDSSSSSPGGAEYDYAVVAVPFSVVRGWRLPKLGLTITNAINKLPMVTICKVALEYRTRFWEHFENPIYGGCSTSTDIPGVGSVCYPSYNLNGTGPASLLASFNFGDISDYFAAKTEAEHVGWVVDAMAEIHGDVAREQYTGNFRRKCWRTDPLEVGGFANPTVGQAELYIPEFFKTHKNLVFVGEHTAYTHAWVASALESGVRGAVQLMLELGLVDEAKAAVNKWMARWIDI